ncbi:hypothetical protein [Saprospira grandis]|uniref:hypothetical protein n=1 Tax=Saprospira grandis TaxID=1008 RepID=UPI0022DDDF6A|nr:hypothetical protein [Saprospira grandis]WBM76051.1 hypothetical protein OP864_07400 [Saprospira grandis]
MKLIVTVIHVPLSGGFWGLKDDQGQEYLPTNLEEKYAKAGLRLEIMAKEAEDYFSVQMWGTPIEILELKVL